MQEDKEALFSAHDQTLAMTRIAAATLGATRFQEKPLRKSAADPALVATEIADYLVNLGVPFRDAHEIVGKVLRAAEQEGKTDSRNAARAAADIFARLRRRSCSRCLRVDSALARRSVTGGTAPTAVRAALDDFKARLVKLEDSHEAIQQSKCERTIRLATHLEF